MPVCSYLVIPEANSADILVRRLGALPACDVTRAENREVLLLVTDTPGPDEDRDLRARIERIEGIHAMVLTFGEIDPETEESDPIRSSRKKERGSGRRSRRLPVVSPDALADVISTRPAP